MIGKRWIGFFLVLALLAVLVSACGSQPTPTPEQATPQQATATTEPTSKPTLGQAVVPPVATQASRVQIALDQVKRIEGEPLATVNGEDVTWEDYEVILRQTLQAIDRQNAVDWSDPAMRDRLGDLQNQVLRQAVDRVLLRQIAAEHGIAVDPSEVQAAVEKQKAQILESDQYANWDAFLYDNGLTDETFEQIAHDTLLLTALLEIQEIQTQDEQVQIAHISVSDEALAQEIVSKLQASEDFGELAAEYSEDEETRDSGGDLGWFSQISMIPELAQAAFSLQPGQFSGVIATQFGYTIILVLDRQVRDADANVIMQRQQQALVALLDTKRSSAEIVYLVDFTQ
jgi:foldase protein PrsA